MIKKFNAELGELMSSMMLDKNLFEKYASYYEQPEIRSQIVAIAHKREVCFLAAGNEERKIFNQRVNKIEYPKDYDFWFMNRIGIRKNKCYVNVYISLPIYENGLPSWPWDEHRKENKHVWVKDSINHIERYDFLIDTDAETHDDVYLTLNDVKKCLIKCLEKKWNNIVVTFSGMGFHILIPMNQVTQNRNFIPNTDLNIYSEYKLLAKQFFNDCSQRVDLNIYDHMRLMKCPYSIAHYEDVAYVAHTFESIDELNDFDLKHFNIMYYHEYPLNVFNKLKRGKLGLPVMIQWQDEQEIHQLLKRLKIE